MRENRRKEGELLGAEDDGAVGEELEEGRLAGVGEGNLYERGGRASDQKSAGLKAADLVDVDYPGAVDAAEAVEGQLLLQRFEGHKGHQGRAVGFMDDDIVAFSLDIYDVVKHHLGHHQVHLDGDRVGSGLAAREGIDLAFQAVDVPLQPLILSGRFTILEGSLAPFVGHSDCQGGQDHQYTQYRAKDTL